jgi:hypothetical protein
MMYIMIIASSLTLCHQLVEDLGYLFLRLGRFRVQAIQLGVPSIRYLSFVR